MRAERSVFIGFIFICCVFFSSAVTARVYAAGAPAGIPKEYELAAENGTLALYMNRENLTVALVEKATGRTLKSGADEAGTESSNDLWKGFMRSGFAIEFYNDRSSQPERLDAYNGSPVITPVMAAGGFDAHVYYEKQDIGFDIRVRLTADGMTAEVPADSVRDNETMKICGMYLYQFMGATLPGEAGGYMLIPEGAGALIDLKDNGGKYKAPYRKRIFGDNIGIEVQRSAYVKGMPAPKEPVPILMPLYGIAHTSEQTAFLAVAEEGAYNAEMLAYPNGAITPYNWAAFRFGYRELYSMHTTKWTSVLTAEKTPYLRDLKIRFIMLTGEKADYSGMALAYRDYLNGKGYLPGRDADFKARIDFLGAETKKWLMFDVTAPMTTVSQMREILTDLTDAGMKDIFALYRGWQAGGLTKNYGSGNFSMEGKLGGFKDIDRLQSDLAGANVTLALYQDFLLANENRLYNTSSDIVKGVSQILIHYRTYAYPFNTLYYLTPRRIAELTRQYAGSKAGGYPLAAGSLGDVLFSYYSKGSVYSRGDTAEGFQKALDVFGEGGAAFERPFEYMLPYTAAFLDMPMYSSNYNFITAEVPFLPMALSGSMALYAEYVNFQPNEREFFLKMIEYGAYPSFLLTGETPDELRLTNSSWIYVSGYDIFKDRIRGYSDELRDIRLRTDGGAAKRHDILEKGVTRVEYDNGVSIIVNYNAAPCTYEGITVGPKSYAVVGRG